MLTRLRVSCRHQLVVTGKSDPSRNKRSANMHKQHSTSLDTRLTFPFEAIGPLIVYLRMTGLHGGYDHLREIPVNTLSFIAASPIVLRKV